MHVSPIPTVTLNNGVLMPQLGLGVYKVPNEVSARVVEAALEAGYRSIDTASMYGNESGVGRGIAQSGVARNELFITSKVWITQQGHDAALHAYEDSLERLGLDYLDLFLIHWPAPERDLYDETWRALEKLYRAGRVRAIGVSNFEPEHLDRISGVGRVVPAVNQVELHPRFQNRRVVRDCAARGIALEAYSPMAQGEVLDEGILERLAQRYAKSPAQIVLRWHVQQGRITIPKSVSAERIKENVEVFDFELTAEELELIDTLERNGRRGSHPADLNG